MELYHHVAELRDLLKDLKSADVIDKDFECWLVNTLSNDTFKDLVNPVLDYEPNCIDHHGTIPCMCS